MKLIIGYQYGDNGSYIGPYSFPANEDKEEAHMPPNTTLDKPPTAGPNKEAAMDLVTRKWVLRAKDLSWMATQ